MQTVWICYKSSSVSGQMHCFPVLPIITIGARSTSKAASSFGRNSVKGECSPGTNSNSLPHHMAPCAQKLRFRDWESLMTVAVIHSLLP